MSEKALKDARDSLTLSVALLSEADDVVSRQADCIAELEARVKVLEDVADAAENVVKSLPMFSRHASVRVLTRRLAALNPSARSE